MVIGTDAANTLIPEMKRYLQTAQDFDIFVFFVLWNGALMRNDKVKQLFYNETKLQSYIDKVLIPMAVGLGDEPALGGWEIMNEPEGSVRIQSDSEPCFSTDFLKGSGAGWAKTDIPMRNLQKFVNW